MPLSTLQLETKKMGFSKVDCLIIVGVIFLASLFRFWNNTEIGIRGDEAVYAGQALLIAGNEELERFFVLASRGTSNFLLHQFLQAIVYSVGGFSDFTTRFLSGLLSIGTVVLVFLIGRQLFGRWTGVLAAVLLAVNGYHVALGRLALLDSTMVFFFTLSILFFLQWLKTDNQKWFYLLAAASGMTVMAKVPGIILIPIILITIFLCRRGKSLNLKNLSMFTLVFLLAMSPAFYQVSLNPEQYLSFLSEGTSRVSIVNETYYFDKLNTYAGPLFLGLTIFGIIPALLFRKTGDLLCLVWFGSVLIFFLAYPLKGWNYILPITPAAAILGARGITYLTNFLKPVFSKKSGLENPISWKAIIGVVGIVLLVAVVTSQSYVTVYNMTYDRPFVGLREASFWLRDNIPPEAGVMTISQGSAQYVLSLYSNVDAYPHGNFRLHTILPGGESVPGAPPPDPLIQDGTVTYLVHYISTGGDDPVHILNKKPGEKRFIEFVQKYDSKVRYVFYDEYIDFNGDEISQPRLWIYEVGKRLPEPQVEIKTEGNTITVTGKGFLIDDFVSIYYASVEIDKITTNNEGSFNHSFTLPPIIPGAQLIIFDEAGNRVFHSLNEYLGNEIEVDVIP